MKLFIRCACCGRLTLKSLARKVRQKGQEYYLAPKCYKAAVEVHDMFRPDSRAAEAQAKYQRKQR